MVVDYLVSQTLGGWKPYREHDTVLVIDFGGQYAHLIARRLRDVGVYSLLVLVDELSRSVVEEVSPKAIILSGGPSSVYAPGAPKIPEWILELGVPVLGICYGFQLLALMLGGVVERGRGEYGRTKVRLVKNDLLFDGWESVEVVWMSHSDYVARVPSGVDVLAVSENGYIAAFRAQDKPVYGVQFHPEVTHTPKGKLLLYNFAVKVAGCRATWRPEAIVDRLVDYVRRVAGSGGRLLAAVSGGVDSTTAALIARKAVGKRLVTVFVDHGLLREGEREEVLGLLRQLGLEPVFIDASERFLSKLWGVCDCEERRKIVGEEFARIFQELVEELGDVEYLVQGTTYPDVIESGAVRGADRIKTHHNVGGLPSWLKLKLVEPLRLLYKDEVRRIALSLGVPYEAAYRHPFPGPGLAVRVIGKFTREKLEIVRKASKIVEEVLKKRGLYYTVWQAFAVVGDDRWVGVKGDRRAVGYIVTIRVVLSEDAMTADWARLPAEVLDEISRRITWEIPEVTMVTYAITTKPPSTIEPC